MKYLKYTAYVYLVAAVFFLIHGISELKNQNSGYWLSFFLTAMSVFMFFFRRRFSEKMAKRQQHDNNTDQSKN
jgi:hypothetical protein